jgi:hypothetical protein
MNLDVEIRALFGYELAQGVPDVEHTLLIGKHRAGLEPQFVRRTNYATSRSFWASARL